MEVKNISAGYGNKQVLFDISFRIDQGETALLIGGNGAGKSTILKTIYGQIKPYDSGKVIFDDEDITGLHSSKMIRRGLVYIPQKDNYFEDLTVLENLEVAGLTIKDKKILKKRICHVFDVFPILADFRKRTPFKMSGGERQLLTLGMALLHNPKMLLLDEPTAGLSPKNTSLVLENIRELNKKGITFIIVEHKVKETIKLASRIIGLKYGRIHSIIESDMYDINNYLDNSYIKLLDDLFV